MPYNINRYSGSLLTTVEDGTVDNTLDIKLIGRNYAGYGEVQNENMVHLLENFANTSEPPRKITGQLWYDSGTRKLKFYDGTKFRTTGGAEVGTTAPSNLTVGDFWFNSQSNQLYAYAGDTKGFILVGPQSVEDQGTTELKSVQIVDTGGAEHAIVKAIIDDVTVFIISNDEFLLPDTGNNAIPGFKLIKKGMTLVDTSTVSSGDPNFGVTTSQYRFWGTTSNALKLEGKTSDDFVLKSSPEFQGVVGFDNDGYTVGTQDTLRVNIGSDGNPVFKSVKLDGIIKFLTKSSADNGASDKKPMSLRGNDILPGEHLISGIGTSDLKFKSVYALDFYGAFRGVADNAENLNVGGTYIEGSYGATANSVAARDNNGAITATQFLGLSQRASNIAGGLEGSLPYQSAPGVTTFLPKGNNNEVLSVNGTGQLDWVPITSLVNAGNADAVQIETANLINATHYLTFVSGTTGYQPLKIDATGLTYNPNTNTLSSQFFNGQATTANYADLAEKFIADKEYETGTVLMVGGEKEVTACEVGRRAVGVVSAKPAFLMNNELEGGTMMALKGRVPVKVRGAVIKGQKLIAGEDGAAIVSPVYSGDVFAIALESKNEQGIDLVECLIL